MQTTEHSSTIVASFRSRAEARAAIAALHKAHHKHTWLGTTSVTQQHGVEKTTVETPGWFFGGAESLVEVLVKHGVPGDTARSIEAQTEPGGAVVTVDPKDEDTSEITGVLRSCGGRVGGTSDAYPSTLGGGNAFDEGNLDDFEYEEMLFERR